jgi:hypothetical protein
MADDVERLYQRLLECDDVLEEVLVATRLLRQVDRIYPPVLAIPRLTTVIRSTLRRWFYVSTDQLSKRVILKAATKRELLSSLPNKHNFSAPQNGYIVRALHFI